MNFSTIKSLLTQTILVTFLFATLQQPLEAQTVIRHDCFSDDLGGLASLGNPDNIYFENIGPDNLLFEIDGCLTPSFADNNDLFSFEVPEGYQLESIYFGAGTNSLFDHTELRFRLWFGTDCEPVFEPAASYGGITNGDPLNVNLIASLDLPLGPGWYSGWVDINLISTTRYYLYFVLSCNDGVPPSFTTQESDLDGTVSCSDEAGLDALLALEPDGFDLGGGAVSLTLLSDESTPDPDCPASYTRVRTWELEDACGNVASENFVQTITVADNTPPVVDVADSEIFISDPAGYELTVNDVLVDAYDLCDTEDLKISINPSMLTCAQLNTTVPVTVIVEDACGNQTQSIANITVSEDLAIKAPWSNDNIGNTANGSATSSPCSGNFVIKSKGFSMPNSDVSHMAYVELCGDGEITTQVTSMSPAGGWAGVMIRESLAPGAKKMAVKTNTAMNIRRDVRTTTNGFTQSQQSLIAPTEYWLRVNRTGNNLTAYASTDGQQWAFLGTTSITMGNCILMGLFVESTNNNLEISGTFDNVSISGGIQALETLQEAFVKMTEVLTPAHSENENQVLPKSLPYGSAKMTSIKAYPNPTSGAFHLNLNGFGGNSVMVRIFDATGKEILSKAVNAAAESEKFDLSGFAPGLYLVRAQGVDGQVQTLKLMFGNAVRN